MNNIILPRIFQKKRPPVRITATRETCEHTFDHVRRQVPQRVLGGHLRPQLTPLQLPPLAMEPLDEPGQSAPGRHPMDVGVRVAQLTFLVLDRLGVLLSELRLIAAELLTPVRIGPAIELITEEVERLTRLTDPVGYLAPALAREATIRQDNAHRRRP